MRKIFIITITLTCLLFGLVAANLKSTNIYHTGGNVKNFPNNLLGGMCFVTGDPHAYGYTTKGSNISFSSDVTFQLSGSTDIREVAINLNLKVFPNPTSNEFTVEILNNTVPQWRLQIYEMTGKKIIDDQYSGCNTRISMLPYAAGMYLVKIVQNNNTLLGQFNVIKQ